MKNIILILITFLSISSYAQITDTIDVSFDKSVYLIFDGQVKTDKGSQEIIVREAGNKVILQAQTENFYETNLLVQVGEKYYMFIVRYNNNPKKLFWNYQNIGKAELRDNKDHSGGVGNGKKENKNHNPELVDYKVKNDLSADQRKQDSLKSYFLPYLGKMDSLNQEIFNRGRIEGKMKFVLTNLRIHDNHIFINLKIDNNSKIKYQMDYVDFRVINKKKVSKQNAEQELRLEPEYIAKESDVIEGKSNLEFTYVLPKFVLENSKKLVVEIWEYNGGLKTEGGRKIAFDVYAEDIINIKGF